MVLALNLCMQYGINNINCLEARKFSYTSAKGSKEDSCMQPVEKGTNKLALFLGVWHHISSLSIFILGLSHETDI
jgi:hypothetical protein